ncbi:MAG TPA: COX15/CtaA family protein [Candidatus Nitrosopolaris sp.]|nr:COX15/CtaA family protein [Candidatus Nitrosopolaris sp.]
MPEPSSRGLHRLAVVTASATVLLLFAGGLVTSTGSGLAVPDWPLSFGQVFPPMVGGVLFEHGHRLVATTVGCLTLALALWTVLREPRPGVRALGLLMLFAVILQGVLGGVTVLYRLPLAVSVAHACLAQIFFCLAVTLAVVTGEGWRRVGPPPISRHAPALPTLAALTTTVVFAQIVVGALMRHMKAGLAIPDFPLSFGRLVPPLATPLIAVNFVHRVGALLVVVLVGWTAVRVAADAVTLRRLALQAVVLVGLQITLGALTIWSARAVLPTTTHLVVGATLLATCLVLTLRLERLERVDAAPLTAPQLQRVPA